MYTLNVTDNLILVLQLKQSISVLVMCLHLIQVKVYTKMPFNTAYLFYFVSTKRLSQPNQQELQETM